MRLHATLFVFLLVALLAAVPLAAQSKPDMSGVWKLNVDKSDLGGKPITELVVTVEHKDPVFKYTVKGVAGGQDFEQTESFTTDGKVNQTENGALTARWDGPVLAVEFKSNDGSVTEKIRFALAANGKGATRDVEEKSPEGERKYHEIYEKQ